MKKKYFKSAMAFVLSFLLLNHQITTLWIKRI